VISRKWFKTISINKIPEEDRIHLNSFELIWENGWFCYFSREMILNGFADVEETVLNGFAKIAGMVLNGFFNLRKWF